ncbi:MAG: ferritin-like domain-containing protein [Anaerotignaceae bacterium]
MYPYNIDKPIQKASPDGTFPEPISSDERLLELLIIAMEYEVDQATKYNQMAEATTDEESKDMLRSMYLDENRHKVLLNEIYTQLSGSGAPEIVPEEITLSENFDSELKRNIVWEIEEAEFYRDLTLMLDEDYLKDILQSILNDEQNHAILNTYLLIN